MVTRMILPTNLKFQLALKYCQFSHYVCALMHSNYSMLRETERGRSICETLQILQLYLASTMAIALSFRHLIYILLQSHSQLCRSLPARAQKDAWRRMQRSVQLCLSRPAKAKKDTRDRVYSVLFRNCPSEYSLVCGGKCGASFQTLMSSCWKSIAWEVDGMVWMVQNPISTCMRRYPSRCTTTFN